MGRAQYRDEVGGGVTWVSVSALEQFAELLIVIVAILYSWNLFFSESGGRS
jgi:hypothetical protein